MLGKKYSLGSTFESTGESRIKIANFNELRSQSKEIAEFLNSFSADPNYMYLHVIAMGAGEYYGCNINGDYFPERDLIARHNTFVTTAKVFKEHDNKPTSPSYGNVVFSWYNPKMHRVELILAIDKVKGAEFVTRQERGEQLEVSMGCFPAGTQVTMADNSRVNIEDVKPGDLVLTHTGEHHKVNTKMLHYYTGTLYTFRIAGQSRSLSATHNHPVLVRRYCNELPGKNQKFLYKDQWVAAEDIKLGDYVLTPINAESSNSTVNEDTYKGTDSLSHCIQQNLPDTFIDGRYIVHKIKAIESKGVQNLPVYNFSIDVDESFVVENVAVHNCRVAFDVCSICGNKAKRSVDYCDHIRMNKKKVYPDGKQAYMINYNPTFFDISIVRRRADRIAYVLDKVASVQNNLQDVNASYFDDLESVIPYAPTEAESVFDIDDTVEKVASDDTVPVEKNAMIKRVSADAVKVINTGIKNSLPIMEKLEHDLPVPLLDRIATTYSLPDILHTALLKAIPLKPIEVSRIIVIQNGLDTKDVPEVLKGVLAAIPRKHFEQGAYSSDLGTALEPYLMNRSSLLPAVMDRISKVIEVEKTAAQIVLDTPNAYWNLNPALSFGHVRDNSAFTDLAGEPGNTGLQDVHKHPYVVTPIQRTSRVVQHQMSRPPLRDPGMSPLQTGLTLGAIYAAYRNSDTVRSLLSDPKSAALLAAAALYLHNRTRTPSVQYMQEKVASWKGTAAAIGIPFVGAHYLAAHYRNKYYQGQPLSSFERGIAENPDIISIAAPAAVFYATKGKVKKASIDEEFTLEKIAEFSDNAADLANNVFTGIILHGKRRSILSGVLDNMVDSKIMNKLTQQNT